MSCEQSTMETFDLKPGCGVTVRTLENDCWKGQLLENPIQTEFKNAITLVNPINSTTKKRIRGNYTLFYDEIEEVKLGHKAKDEEITKAVETTLNTVFIKSWSQLEHFYGQLSQNGVDEIGCHVENILRGRFTVKAPQFLVLNVRHTIFVLFLYELTEGQREERLWEGLGKNIFSNRDITKIFFDSCTASDYLYNCHSISLVNVFDLKIADRYLTETGGLFHFQNELPNKSAKTTLAQFLDVYLPKQFSMKEYVVVGVTESYYNLSCKVMNVAGVEEYKEKSLVLRVKYLLAIRAAMERAMMSPLEMLLDCTTRRMLNSSKEEAESMFSSNSSWDE